MDDNLGQVVLVADINPGVVENYSSNPGYFGELNGKLYFSADDGENGRELWVSDGTSDGTQLLEDINPNNSSRFPSSNLRNLTEFNGKLYFSADDGENGRELWVTDGTSEGTQLLKNINTNNDGSAWR